MASLLAKDRAQAAASPIRPLIRPENPLAPRQPHFPAKAKRVLILFCSGAVSHVDSWDWKPELLRMILAILVLAVAFRMGLQLTYRPEEIYTVQML